MTTNSIYRIRKNFGSMPEMTRVFWVDHTNGTVGGRFRDMYGTDFCEAVSFDELSGERAGVRMTDDELIRKLELMASVVCREPNV